MAQTSSTLLGPEEVRTLRGDMSRESFARLVGVTPLTVYRWELPDGAPQARRPRGAVAESLRRLRASGSAGALASSESPASLLAAPAAPAAPAPGEPALELALLLPLQERLGRAEWRKAEEELLELRVSGRLRSREGRALATSLQGLILLMGRNDTRAAYTALLPLLEEAQTGTLAPLAQLHVHALAALLHAFADGRLFDPGKVGAHLSRAEPLLPADSTGQARWWLLMAQLVSAFHVGEPGLMRHALAQTLGQAERATTPVARCFLDEARGLQAMMESNSALAVSRWSELAERAAALDFRFLEARARVMLAARRLDDGAEPTEVLELVRQLHAAILQGRLNPGQHSVMLARVESEALLRQGRFAEAEAVLREGEATVEERCWTPVNLLMARARLLGYQGRTDELRVQGARGLTFERPVQRALTRAHGAYMVAHAALVEGAPTAVVLEAQAQAHRWMEEAGGWPFLQRQLVVEAFQARLAEDDTEAAQLALRRAERVLDRMPSVWHGALLRQGKGLLLCRQGRAEEGQQLLEAALATFTLAGDLPQAALTRRALARLAVHRGTPEASSLLSASEEELQRLGLVMPALVRGDWLPPVTRRAAPGSAEHQGARALVVPVERLSVRGIGPSLLLRELLSVVGEVLPGRAVRLEEVDSRGGVLLLAGQASSEALEWVEFGDGGGRRLRLGVAGTLDDTARAQVRTLTSVASLALEVATLRGFSEQVAQPMEEPAEAPGLAGFLAASPVMRKLRAELRRLAGSRATIIITGESGSGKEVVARALHDVSVRKGQPYVAFNCAAVPRELFEGQLFGYRKGAFTGATSDHPGVIRAAHQGTLFIDEIGELPLDLQPKLLRFLENGEVFPLGEKKPVRVDVRVITATHRDLEAMVREGRFREDLFYRLQVVPLRVPPLRERPEDVFPLARHFVQQLTPSGMEPPVLGPDAVALLMGFAWPGNVRQLRNVIERAMAFAPIPKVLTAQHLHLRA